MISAWDRPQGLDREQPTGRRELARCGASTFWAFNSVCMRARHG
jgi:hypothetical protein